MLSVEIRQQLWGEAFTECLRNGKILLQKGGLDPLDLYVVSGVFEEKMEAAKNAPPVQKTFPEEESMLYAGKLVLHGYTWTDPYEGGCFVYPHDDHPEHATPVYTLSP